MEELQRLKKERKAVILAHYYVDEEIQKAADYVGDSFYLAQIAKDLDCEVIVVAGVRFMGESIKILNPDKRVLMVDPDADCPMAHMVKAEKIQEMREGYEDLAVVTYINSTAEIKAHSDICVTSSNALSIVRKLRNKNIFFAPDRNLGSYVARFAEDKNILLNEGWCPVHDKVEVCQIEDLKRRYPRAKVLAHPECRKEVLEKADYIGSTKGIIGQAAAYEEEDLIIVTEIGIDAELRARYPQKRFHYPEGFLCGDMKRLTPEKLRQSLMNMENEIQVDPKIAEKALISLNRMLEFGAEK